MRAATPCTWLLRAGTSSSCAAWRPWSGEPPLAAKDALQLAPETREEPLDGALDLLLHRSFVNRTEPCRDLIAILEVFGVGRAPFNRLQIRHAAQLLVAQPVWPVERPRASLARGNLDEVAPDRERVARTVSLASDGSGLIFSDPDADDHRRGEADEPRVLEIVRRSGLSADRESYAVDVARRRSGPAIDNVLEHRDHLVRDLGGDDALLGGRVVEGDAAVGVDHPRER